MTNEELQGKLTEFDGMMQHIMPLMEMLKQQTPANAQMIMGLLQQADADKLFYIERLGALKKIMIEMKADASNTPDSSVGRWIARMEAILGSAEE